MSVHEKIPNSSNDHLPQKGSRADEDHRLHDFRMALILSTTARFRPLNQDDFSQLLAAFSPLEYGNQVNELRRLGVQSEPAVRQVFSVLNASYGDMVSAVSSDYLSVREKIQTRQHGEITIALPSSPIHMKTRLEYGEGMTMNLSGITLKNGENGKAYELIPPEIPIIADLETSGSADKIDQKMYFGRLDSWAAVMILSHEKGHILRPIEPGVLEAKAKFSLLRAIVSDGGSHSLSLLIEEVKTQFPSYSDHITDHFSEGDASAYLAEEHAAYDVARYDVIHLQHTLGWSSPDLERCMNKYVQSGLQHYEHRLTATIGKQADKVYEQINRSTGSLDRYF